MRLILKSHQFLSLGEQHMSGAAGQQRVQSSFLKNFQIGLPSFEEQIEIVNYVENEINTIAKAISKAEKEIGLIQEYKNRLITDVVTGKIDVRSVQVPYFQPIEADLDLSNEELVIEVIEE